MSDDYYCIPTHGIDLREHTDDHLFCDDMSCPCHEDDGNNATLQEWYSNGLIGSVDGDLIYRGRTV